MIQKLMRQALSWVARVGVDPQDSDEMRLQKSSLVLGSVMFIIAGALWGILYWLFDQPLAGSIPLSYAVVSFLSVIAFHLTHRYSFFRFSQLLLILLLPFFLMIALGGFVASSAVILWSLISPLSALLFDEPRHVLRWLAAYLGLLVVSGILESHPLVSSSLSPTLVTIFFVLNVGTVSTIAVILLTYFVSQKNMLFGLLQVEQAKSENLLLNILPKEIAAILKNESRTIADHVDGASILFADMVNFTPLSVEMKPAEMVELLNEVFSHFDSLVEKYELEKIRTIGDSYMVASGVPRPRPDHAQAVARLALDMRSFISSDPSCVQRRLDFRIGINSGPVVAGVIGHKKFIYDLWGDAVNTASRMESHGVPGKIQITRDTYELIKDEFECEPRGTVVVKGKGEMETWYLVGVKHGPV